MKVSPAQLETIKKNLPEWKRCYPEQDAAGRSVRLIEELVADVEEYQEDKIRWLEEASELNNEIAVLKTELQAQKDANEKLQKFKDYVHKRLDDAGVDKHEEQNVINGCRIGARLDDVLDCWNDRK